MKSETCKVCGGFGEAMVLSNPQDHNDGSYEMHQCPACGGTGVEREGWARRKPARTRKEALELATKAIDSAFKRSCPPKRTPSDS